MADRHARAMTTDAPLKPDVAPVTPARNSLGAR